MTEPNLSDADPKGMSDVNPGRVRQDRKSGWPRIKRKAKKFVRRLRLRLRNTTQPRIIRLNGVRIPIERELYSKKNIARLYDESYEADEREALSRTLRPGDRLLELGSGIGYMSSYAASTLGVSRVTACEANPSLIPIISRVHGMNGVDSEILHGVMSRDMTTRSCTFYTQRHFSASSLQQPDGEYQAKTVPVLHWQTELDRIQPTYLLMDIEGGEIDLLEVFDHASVERMLIEFHPKITGEASIERIFEHLRSIGFQAARPHGGTNVWYFER